MRSSAMAGVTCVTRPRPSIPRNARFFATPPPSFPHRPSPLPFPARRSRTPTFARAQVDAAETAYRRLRDAVRGAAGRTPAICPAGSCSRRLVSALSLRVDELRTGRDLGVSSATHARSLRALFQGVPHARTAARGARSTSTRKPGRRAAGVAGSSSCAQIGVLSRPRRGGRGSTSSTREHAERRRGRKGRSSRHVPSARARRPAAAHPQLIQIGVEDAFEANGGRHRRARDGFGGEDALGLAARGRPGERPWLVRESQRGVRRRHLRARADASARARGGYRRGGRRRLVRDRATGTSSEEKDGDQGVVLLLAVGAGPVAADHAAQSGGVPRSPRI